MTTATATKPNREDFLEEARKRFERAEQAESLIRERGKDDLAMRAGDQWDPEIKRTRMLDGRPCLTVNRLPQFVRQVCNDQRQNRPAIKVSPVDDQADKDTAKVLQGLIRHIEYDSGADAAYDQAFESAATSGIGYFRIITEYSDPMSFDLDIKIKRIRNPFSVYIDPDAKEADRSDMRWAFIVDDFSKAEFEARYPDADVCKAGESGWDLARAAAPSWMQGESVRVAEYFCITTKKATVCLLDDGHVMLKAQYDRIPEGMARPGIQKERPTEVPTVKWCKIVGTEVLEETEWPGRWIPIVPVMGNELEVDGQVVLEGVIRHAKDTQRMLNVWVSAETEIIGLAPRSPWLVAEGQLEGREKIWGTATTRNHAFLTYKPTALNGQPVAPPSRVFGEANVQSVTNARMQAQDDLKSLTGIFDSALGAQSNETSGIAIRQRQSQSGTANFHLVDNLTRAIRHGGRILVDLMPHVYDTAKVARVIGEDGEVDMVVLNQLFQDPKTGEPTVHNMGVGKYDVTVTAGPSYSTKRQEAAASMMELTQSYPALAEVAGDLIVKNMDWPGAQEISERLKKGLPPQFQEQEQGQQGPQVPPEMMAKLQEQQQVIQQLQQALGEASDVRMDKAAELQSKEKIEFAKIDADIEKAKIQAAASAGSDTYLQTLAEVQQHVAFLGELLLSKEQGPVDAEPLMAGGEGMDATGGAAPGPYGPGELPGM